MIAKGFRGQSARFWKNERVFDRQGLVVCEQKERLFDNLQCGQLFEDLLKIYQNNGLKLHYLYNPNLSKQDQEIETITYKVYINWRCIADERMEKKIKMVGNFYVDYRIVKLDSKKVASEYPYLLLFNVRCGEKECQKCGQKHLYKIYQSNFYVVRTQFIYELIPKLKFMDKYPSYVFKPNSFESTKKHQETIYEYIKDHNYQPSYYFERCEHILINSLRMFCMKKNMDFEGIRIDDYAKMKKMTEVEKMEYVDSFRETVRLIKLKYMCRKCQPQIIWTAKNQVKFAYRIEKMEQVIPLLENKVVYEELKLKLEPTEVVKKEKSNPNPEERMSIAQLYKTAQRNVDRSVENEIQDYLNFQGKYVQFGRWHETLHQYRNKYMVIFSITVPKMCCDRCKKEKDGLIFLKYLVGLSQRQLNEQISKRIQKLQQQQDSSQQ